MHRMVALSLLAFSAVPEVKANIIHFCFGGVYYQWSVEQNKGITAGTCGRKAWIYLEETDALLLQVPGHDTKETVERHRGRRPVRAVSAEEIARAASASTEISRIRAAPAAMGRPGGPKGPPPCREGEYPPCHGDCWGLPPGLCSVIGRKSGVAIRATTGPKAVGGTGPRTPCPPGTAWNGSACATIQAP